MKQKKSKWQTKKKEIFFKITNSQNFFAKNSWIGPWVSRINWCKGHWFGSTYMVVRLSYISSKQPKNTKNTFFVCFWAYVGQPHDLISWAVPMPFASINSTIPRTNPWEFHEKILRIGGAGKWGFFEAAILNFLSRPFWFFFLLHLCEKSSPFIWGKKNFCTMDGFSRILEKKFCHLLCTRLYIHEFWGLNIKLRIN